LEQSKQKQQVQRENKTPSPSLEELIDKLKKDIIRMEIYARGLENIIYNAGVRPYRNDLLKQLSNLKKSVINNQ
jgi:hypothetical protein